MKSCALLELFGTSLLLGAAGFAETRPDYVQDRFQNLDFAASTPGVTPLGWHLGPEGTPVYAAQTAGSASCNGGKQCGNLRSIGTVPHGFCFLYQIVDATPYRGKLLAYRATVRADVAGTSVARLLVRIHREDGSTSFRDDMGSHPITSGPWALYEIGAPIPSDARDIEFGMQLFGEGSASIDNISLVFGNPQDKADGESIRALIRKFADLRNVHDGPSVAALYSENGEWSGPYGKGAVRGRQALSTLWGSVSGYVGRTIESVDFLGGDVAMIRATTQYADPIGRHHESFIVVKENGVWYIRAHQSVD
jgi:hypothetical protein